MLSKLSYEVLHNRFNGRRHEVLKHLDTALTSTTRDWTRILGKPPDAHCPSCLEAHADRIPSKAHVPPASEPGYISYDIFEMGVGHIHGGHKYVIGFHDTYSRVNKIYVLAAKSDAYLAMRKFHAWANSHGVTIRRMHADNAGELTGADLKREWEAKGIRLSACAPNEPRGNWMMERQWRTMANDTQIGRAHV